MAGTGKGSEDTVADTHDIHALTDGDDRRSFRLGAMGTSR